MPSVYSKFLKESRKCQNHSYFVRFSFDFLLHHKKNPMFNTIPKTVAVGAAKPIMVRLAFGWILIT